MSDLRGMFTLPTPLVYINIYCLMVGHRMSDLRGIDRIADCAILCIDH